MIVLDNVTKRFGPKILFENVSMQFDPGKRYGLTGANGAGKSTLLKMLEGNEETDQGSITIPSKLRLGVLRQLLQRLGPDRVGESPGGLGPRLPRPPTHHRRIELALHLGGDRVGRHRDLPG